MNWFEIITSILFWPALVSICIIGGWRTDSIKYAKENAELKERIKELSEFANKKTICSNDAA